MHKDWLHVVTDSKNIDRLAPSHEGFVEGKTFDTPKDGKIKEIESVF